MRHLKSYTNQTDYLLNLAYGGGVKNLPKVSFVKIIKA